MCAVRLGRIRCRAGRRVGRRGSATPGSHLGRPPVSSSHGDAGFRARRRWPSWRKSRARLRTFPGRSASRSNRLGLRATPTWRRLYRPSCRRPDRRPDRREAIGSAAGGGSDVRACSGMTVGVAHDMSIVAADRSLTADASAVAGISSRNGLPSSPTQSSPSRTVTNWRGAGASHAELTFADSRDGRASRGAHLVAWRKQGANPIDGEQRAEKHRKRCSERRRGFASWLRKVQSHGDAGMRGPQFGKRRED